MVLLINVLWPDFSIDLATALVRVEVISNKLLPVSSSWNKVHICSGNAGNVFLNNFKFNSKCFFLNLV